MLSIELQQSKLLTPSPRAPLMQLDVLELELSPQVLVGSSIQQIKLFENQEQYFQGFKLSKEGCPFRERGSSTEECNTSYFVQGASFLQAPLDLIFVPLDVKS